MLLVTYSFRKMSNLDQLDVSNSTKFSPVYRPWQSAARCGLHPPCYATASEY